ncbi:MAG: lamin tail domain-containing protein, partial [Cyanobacteria bacterium P01_A01_bin.37]
GSGDDVLQGGQGNDRLIGNAGHDVFILAPGTGSDIIDDFEVGVDAIGLGGGLTVDALSISQSGTDMLIRITATGDVLATMLNVFITPIQISAMDDRASGIEGGTITTLENGASSLLANDGSMAEQDSITIVARGDRTTILTEVKASGTENRFTVVTTPVTAPQFGTLSLNTDGTFIYTHDGSQNFADSFTYSVASPEGQTDTATVFLTITAVNDSPVLTSAATVNAAENQIAALDVQSTDDNDSEGAGIIYSITGGPDQAFLTIDSTTGLVTFNTAPDFENPLDAGADNVYDIQVTATDSGSLTNRQNIAITVTDVVETPSGTLFISEYIEGSSFNKALEFHNNSGTIITLDNYTLERYANGSASASQTVNLGTVTGQATLANGETIVLYNSSASAGLITAAGTATIAAPSSIVIHNGNDAYALKESGTIIDLFGTIGQDPGSAWTENSHSTKDQTLQRKLSIAQGNSTGFSVGDTSALENEWDSLAQDTFSGLGSFVVP